MKKLLICVAVLGVLWASPAMAGLVTLVNPGFELPALASGDKIKGFDGDRSGYMGSQYDVPGWQDDCASGSDNHSGIKNGDGQRAVSGQGSHLSFDKGTANETIVWQLTNESVVLGKTYTLSIQGWADGPEAELKASLFYDASGTHTEIASADYSWTSAEHQANTQKECSVAFTIPSGHASIGNNIGIKFENPGSSFTHLDDATLSVIPEPSTLWLMGLSLGALALLRRRRA